MREFSEQEPQETKAPRHSAGLVCALLSTSPPLLPGPSHNPSYHTAVTRAENPRRAHNFALSHFDAVLQHPDALPSNLLEYIPKI